MDVKGTKVGRPLLRSDAREDPADSSTDFPSETTWDIIEEPCEAAEATSDTNVETTGGAWSVSEW